MPRQMDSICVHDRRKLRLDGLEPLDQDLGFMLGSGVRPEHRWNTRRRQVDPPGPERNWRTPLSVVVTSRTKTSNPVAAILRGSRYHRTMARFSGNARSPVAIHFRKVLGQQTVSDAHTQPVGLFFRCLRMDSRLQSNARMSASGFS